VACGRGVRAQPDTSEPEQQQKLTGEGLRSLGQRCTQLKSLNLTGSSIGDTALMKVAGAPSLEVCVSWRSVHLAVQVPPARTVQRHSVLCQGLVLCRETHLWMLNAGCPQSCGTVQAGCAPEQQVRPRLKQPPALWFRTVVLCGRPSA